MRYNDSNLRRRTRDSGWQWLLMGSLLGLGVALVACVGGYALGAITFPALEDKATPISRVVPNETEVAMQAQITQQTLDAQAAPVVATETPAATDDALPAIPTATHSAPPDSLTPSALPGAAAEPPDAAPTTPPAPLAVVTDLTPEAPPAAGDNPDLALAQEPAGQQGTPVVGTPPPGPEAAPLGLPQPAAIPPELDLIKTELLAVTGGTFMMGTTPEEAKKAADECALYGKSCDGYLDWVQDSFPTHPVVVDSFQMELTEVSAQQFVTFLNWLGPNSHKDQCQNQPCAETTLENENSYILYGENGTYSVRNPGFYSNHPITFVTWWGAEEYCATLNRRLPTEAEWERAARGPDNYIYPWGFDFDPQRAMSSLSEDLGTVPVTSYPAGASPFGMLNMAGNVAEWAQDWFAADYYTQLANSAAAPTNPTGPIAGTERVLRGGSWDTIPFFLRSVHRMSAPPDQPRASIGFRCAQDAPLTAPPAQAPASDAGATTSGGAPTMGPAPTRQLPPTPTPPGPTPTLAPG